MKKQTLTKHKTTSALFVFAAWRFLLRLETIAPFPVRKLLLSPSLPSAWCPRAAGRPVPLQCSFHRTFAETGERHFVHLRRKVSGPRAPGPAEAALPRVQRRCLSTQPTEETEALYKQSEHWDSPGWKLGCPWTSQVPKPESPPLPVWVSVPCNSKSSGEHGSQPWAVRFLRGVFFLRTSPFCLKFLQ